MELNTTESAHPSDRYILVKNSNLTVCIQQSSLWTETPEYCPNNDTAPTTTHLRYQSVFTEQRHEDKTSFEDEWQAENLSPRFQWKHGTRWESLKTMSPMYNYADLGKLAEGIAGTLKQTSVQNISSCQNISWCREMTTLENWYSGLHSVPTRPKHKKNKRELAARTRNTLVPYAS